MLIIILLCTVLITAFISLSLFCLICLSPRLDSLILNGKKVYIIWYYNMDGNRVYKFLNPFI